MIKQILALRIAGYVFFHSRDVNGELKLIQWGHNDIQAMAKDITARGLIRDPQAVIDTISLYYQGNLIASRIITEAESIGLDQISFQTTFLPDDFTGSFDMAKLTASGLGDFSIITALVGSKLAVESLMVTWNIQVN